MGSGRGARASQLRRRVPCLQAEFLAGFGGRWCAQRSQSIQPTFECIRASHQTDGHAAFQLWHSCCCFFKVNHRYRTRPGRRLLWLPATAALLTFIFSGCASAVDSQSPTVELSASALAPVGGTIPVFIKRRCTANCGFKSSPWSRRQIAALNESGQYVQALSVVDAAKLAGGTQKLLDGVNSREGNALFLTRSTFSNIYGHDYWGVIFSPLILAYTGYLAAHPEEVEEMRLEEIAIPQSGDQGWVFFPIGNYTKVKASYDWLPSVPPLRGNEEGRTEIIVAPWDGSSSSPGTPFPSAAPPSEHS
jgi:hypothetical protein